MLSGAQLTFPAHHSPARTPNPSYVIAAIHQPNFFPWLGYFDKIARCDVFIVLDDVQYQKKGSSWSNRVRLLVAGEPRWVTAPVHRPPHGTARIDQLRWADDNWREKLLRTLSLNYRGAEFFRPTIKLVEPLVMHPDASLAGFNLHAITALTTSLGLRGRIVRASDYGVNAVSNERLIALCRQVGCAEYLAGGGAGDYQQDELFQAAGITVRYQSFQHPVYAQSCGGSFVPGLSILDALMNCGVKGACQLLRLEPSLGITA